MPSFSLLQPMKGLPLHMWLLWPLIYMRILRLKAWFRENGGPGSQMLWGVMKNGRVIVLSLSDDLSVPRPCSFRAPVSGRLGAALSGEDFVRPPHLRATPTLASAAPHVLLMLSESANHAPPPTPGHLTSDSNPETNNRRAPACPDTCAESMKFR